MPDIDGRQTRRQRPVRPGVTVVLLVLCGLFIAYATLIPFEFGATRRQVAYKRSLFFALSLADASRADVISNVLLFVPWGGLMAVWLASRRVGLGLAGVAAAVSGCALSGLVETLQLFTPSRVSSWIDIATNTTGSALGGGLGWWLARVIWPKVETDLKSAAARYPLAVLTAVAVLGVLLASMAPFDVSLDFGDLRASVKKARLVPFLPAVDHPPPAAEAWGWTGRSSSGSCSGSSVPCRSWRRGLRELRGAACHCGGCPWEYPRSSSWFS